MTDSDVAIENDGFKPLCVFCSAPWSDENIDINFSVLAAGCDTCGHGQEVSYSVDIVCHSCERVMYSKEGVRKT